MIITRIERVIAHEVIRASELSIKNPTYSNALVNLNEQIKNLLINRIITVVAPGSYCVDLTVDDVSQGRPFNIITNMFNSNDNDFIISSKSLAGQLSNAQTAGAIRPGFAIFIQGIVNDTREYRFIAIVKTDPDNGLLEKTNGNQIMFDYINNVILGDSTRLMKLALFIEINKNSATEQIQVRDPDDFSIKVFDYSMRNSTNGNASLYFYSTFLGCRIADSASTKTKQFHEITKKFINDMNINEEGKVRLYGNLLSYLRDNSTIINPREFAQLYFPSTQQGIFLGQCNNSGITESFSKDIQLLKGKLRRESIKFTSNVTIVASPDVFNESVRIIGQDNENIGWIKIRIKGEIENIK